VSVSLTVSKTIAGAQVADLLNGGGSGVDMGLCSSGQYCPIVSQNLNTGWLDLFVRHDAVVDPITDLATSISTFSQTYGGDDTATDDYDLMKTKGYNSGTATANNSDGLGSGLRVEMDADVPGALGLSAFLPSRSQVKIYGRDYGSGQQGITIPTAFLVHQDAMTWNNAGIETDASVPVAGKVGKSGDTVLGDRAHLKMRYYLPSGPAEGIKIQWDLALVYSYTS
jgi:hypothetical protein